MSDLEEDRTASLMTPAKLAQMQVRPRPAASPAAWLDALAADAGSGHVRRLLDLRGQLEAQMRERDDAPVAEALAGLRETLRKLDFAPVEQRGWIARLTGGKAAAAAFVAQVDRIAQAGEDLADEVRALQKRHQAGGAAADRTVLEIGVELRAIEKIMDQGARWLQDMRGQLKTRQAQGGDAAVQQQIDEDTQRCELLVVRLKQLRAVSAATQQVLERCKALSPQRAAFLQGLQALEDGPWKAWQRRSAPVADEAKSRGAASEGVERARAAQQELHAALEQSASDCAGLRQQEQDLAGELAALDAPLKAAA
ncbi:MAG TPA: hypothetical protein VEB23_11035 [Ramlibacter sp.]|nr:hypothetical protein [Ramlibacter sp.]